jgi:ABC-type multidrug transport system fused ATPase/permease subunit
MNKPQEANMSTFNAIRNALNLVTPKMRLIVFFTALGRMASGLFDLVGVASLGMFTSRALNEGNSTHVVGNVTIPIVDSFTVSPTFLLVLGIASFLSKSLVSYFLSVLLARSLYLQSFDITESLVRENVFDSLEKISQKATQEQHFIVTDGVKASVYGVLNNFVSILGDTFLILLFVFMLLLASPVATAMVATILGVVGFLVYRIVAKRMYLAGQHIGSRSIHSIMYFQEAVFGFRELKVSGRLRTFLTKFLGAEKDLTSAQISQGISALLPRYIMEAAVMICLGIVAAVSFGTQDNASALVTVTVFAAATARILPAIVPIQSSLGDLRANTGMAEKFYRYLEENSIIDFTETRLKPSEIQNRELAQDENQRLVLDDVSYKYPLAKSNAINRIDIDLVAPAWVAVVGPSGSGKSTIFDLIMGLRKPTHGQTSINGISATEFLETINDYCLYIPQRLTLSNASLAENVAFGVLSSEIDEEKVKSALLRVGLAEIIDRHTDGIWQDIGELGAKFSGGQGQRLGLARALYSEPKILLLDESTSNLDIETELLITKVIREIADKNLVVSISHRMETLSSVDRVLVMESGKLKFNGSYAEYMQSRNFTN